MWLSLYQQVSTGCDYHCISITGKGKLVACAWLFLCHLSNFQKFGVNKRWDAVKVCCKAALLGALPFCHYFVLKMSCHDVSVQLIWFVLFYLSISKWIDVLFLSSCCDFERVEEWMHWCASESEKTSSCKNCPHLQLFSYIAGWSFWYLISLVQL